MKDIIIEFRYLIVVILAAIIYALANWSKTKQLVVAGILKAKSLAKDLVLTSGQDQEDWVVATVYPLIPLAIKVFVSEGLFRIIVKKTYDTLKDLLDDGKINNSGGIV